LDPSTTYCHTNAIGPRIPRSTHIHAGRPDKDRLASILGGSDIATTTKASGLGALSSACTFGAVTITQTLFKKGASKESTLAFSFASTNLVFELGILIYILLGPAFLAAELAGGVLLIAIMYLLV
jgi:uncharacterized membrane protein YraQ (UPF0718 family)